MDATVLATLPPELRGYIAELQKQIEVLSARAALRSAELFAARQELELLRAELRGRQPVAKEENAASN